LLQAIACARTQPLALDYLDGAQLALEVSPC
jgi:hypothetical protein